MNQIFSEIPGFSTWSNVEEVHKGWSSDKKYYIQTTDGRDLLLRIADMVHYDKKKREFEAVKKLDHIENILMSRPLNFGICNNGQSVYSLFTWIKGEDAEKVIPTLNAAQQYQLGVQAGVILRKMHEIPAGQDQAPWAEYYNAKINRYITNYKACGIPFEGADQTISFIEQHRYLLENRPQTFQHGDYHVGNMVVTPSGELGIIDFNRLDYGDPWEEFNRITWCAGLSPLFASGRIHGYFNNDVPDVFFRLMALYIASNQLSSIHWAIQFGKKEVDDMVHRAEEVLEAYDNFQIYIPKWYLSSYRE
ncbi:aminoglycoside phosphotransferase (plasmid) [Paenibacillus sp. IHB B 3084]|uniref:aminoglycoside phosphotransferase family protein n=1 Tax=unclassified Paenibacillus TaxID=185978 RepID=UPI0007205248|nr:MULTISPECIES: phosphotransferase family protein [unclassified Paenibacillus]ALP39220.1 aminoglycoside phosphotransferase [Paenibacillus sp. IHB B 3084]MBE0339751.1 phosphotransferase family protein [Paenibacillus sp. 23TSA30-6]